MRDWHGGVRGLRKDDKLLPPNVTGTLYTLLSRVCFPIGSIVVLTAAPRCYSKFWPIRRATQSPPFGALLLVSALFGDLVLVFVVVLYLD